MKYCSDSSNIVTILPDLYFLRNYLLIKFVSETVLAHRLIFTD